MLVGEAAREQFGGQDVQAHRLLWHSGEGVVGENVSIFHLILLLIESCDPCTETPLTFERSWEIHQAFGGIW